MNTGPIQQLLGATARRCYVENLGSRFRAAALVVAGLFLAVLLASRLLSLVPAQVGPVEIAAVPLLALIAALLLARRPDARHTARLIDERAETKELFLTAASLADSAAEYQPIVVAQAEARAAEIVPAAIVPFRWQRGARDLAIAALVLAAAVLFLPQLDPFGRDKQRVAAAQQQQRLAETKKLTALRAEQLKSPESAEDRVDAALKALEKTFKEAKPLERDATMKRLAEQQKELGEMWRQASNKQGKDAFEKSAQSFGAVNPQQAQQWREDLKKGDTSALKKELDAARDEMKKLAQMPDSAEKRAAQEQLAQKLAQMSEGMKQAFNSPELQAALQRAMEQLDMAKLSEMNKEAMQAAIDSLNLSEEELKKLAESLKDLKSLEDALKNLQMAKQLCQNGQLDGGECKDCNGQGDYAALYQKLLSQRKVGAGMGDEGIGAGGKAPENDDLESGFKQEKTPTQLSGGKLLLEWKAKELGPTGARAEDFRDAIRQVKQGASEAVISEQVPPGYHEAIRKYFDALPEKAPVPKAE